MNGRYNIRMMGMHDVLILTRHNLNKRSKLAQLLCNVYVSYRVLFWTFFSWDLASFLLFVLIKNVKVYCNLFFNSINGSQRSSVELTSQLQEQVLRSTPHLRHNPLQSSLQRFFNGIERFA